MPYMSEDIRKIHSSLLLSIYAIVLSVISVKIAVSEGFTCAYINGDFSTISY